MGSFGDVRTVTSTSGRAARVKRLAVAFCGALVIVLLIVALLTPDTSPQHASITHRRRSEAGHPDDTAYREYTDTEAIQLINQAYAEQKTAWGAVWHMDDMLSSLAAESTDSLVTKMRQQLSEGGERSQRKRRQTSALPRLLARSHGSQRKVNGSEVPDRMLVVARAEEDVSWLSLFLPDIPHTVYQAGWTPDQTLSWVGPEPVHKAAPQAKETNVYLQYIVDHYDQLPDTIVFMHAHRHSWHMADKVPLLKRLRWGEIAYANLRHKRFTGWDCGSPHEGKNFPCGWDGAIMTPRDPFTKVFAQQPQSGAVARMSMNMHRFWRVFFQEELGTLPELVYTQCCAEFVVARERILAHPKAFYQKMLDTANSYDWQTHYHELAIAFEYAWHLIFGEPPVLAPMAECDMLTCPSEQ